MRYRKVYVKIWNDEKFMNFTDDGKLAFLFIMTHPNMTALGAMRATIPGLAAELGWSEEKFRTAINTASEQYMVICDEKYSLLWMKNFLTYNEPESINSVKAWLSYYNSFP